MPVIFIVVVLGGALSNCKKTESGLPGQEPVIESADSDPTNVNKKADHSNESQKDPDAVLQELQILQTKSDLNDFKRIVKLYKLLASVSPDLLIIALEDYPWPEHYEVLISELIPTLAEQDPDIGILVIQRFITDKTLHKSYMETLLLAAGHRNPESAFRAYAALPFARFRETLSYKLGLELGSQDPAQTLSWAVDLDHPEAREAITGLGLSLAGRSTDFILDMCLQISDVELKKAFISAYAGTVRAKNINDAIEAFAGYPDDLGKIAAEKLITRALKNHGGASELFDQLISGKNSSYLDDTYLIQRIAGEITAISPIDAAARLDQLSSTSAKIAFVKAQVSAWYSLDSLELSQWVRSMVPGELKDNAVIELSSELISSGERDSALAWAETIGDPVLRAGVLDRLK